LVLVLVSACGAEDALIGKDCTSSEDQSWDIDHPDMPTAFKIDQCRVDADTCPALCTFIMQTKQVSSNAGATACDVSFEGAVTHVTATYDITNSGPGCATPEPSNF
jgi:hypothetical protein